MRLEAKKYLLDMQQSCERLLEYTKGKVLQDYLADSLLRSGVERQFQIIGEALFQLDRTHPETADRISEHRGIINFRHVLVHGYDQIEDDVVWGFVVSKLPQLRSELDALLAE